MGSNRQLFVFFFAGFMLFFSLLTFSISKGITNAVEDALCQDNNCRQKKHENYILIFKDDNMEVTMDVEDPENFPTNIGEDSPIDEEWIEVIKAFAENDSPEYVDRHGLVFIQKQKGSYDYSYGNDGTYWSKSHGKVKRSGNQGRLSSLYFQIAVGETKKPPMNYTSGFVIFTDTFVTFRRGSARWQGREKGAYFNKNPDGSYTIFGFSSGGTVGQMTARPGSVEVDTSTYMVLNATHFVSQTVSNSTYRLKFDKVIANLSGALVMETKASPKRANPRAMLSHGPPAFGPLMLSEDKFLHVHAKFDGVYPKSGQGKFSNNFSATISGSIVNSSLSCETKGSEWFEHEDLSRILSLHHAHYFL